MPSSQLSGWNVEVPSNRRLGSSAQGGTTARLTSWNGEQDRQSRNCRLSPKAQTNPKIRQQPDHLTNIKKQWDVERDIPSGAVKNNPFVPKTDQSLVQPPLPQLLHQKRQWDTSAIQRGSVAARTISLESDMPDHAVAPLPSPSPSSRSSPQLWMHHQQSDRCHGRALSASARQSPSASDYCRSSPQPTTVNNGTGSSFTFDSRKELSDTSTPTGAQTDSTTLRGRLIENPFLSAAPVCQQSKWEPLKEIPAGTVKGKVNQLFTAEKRHKPGGQDQRPIDSSPSPGIIPSRHAPGKAHSSHYDASTDDDPWIIPPNKSEMTKIFPDNWGEALAVKSSDSDDWDSPAADWFKSSESQTTMSENAHSASHSPRHHVYNAATTCQNRNSMLVNLGVLEEKKLNEEDIIPRQADSNYVSRRSDKRYEMTSIECDPFGTTHARDAEILQAARQKIRQGTTGVVQAKLKFQSENKKAADVLDIFSTDSVSDSFGFPSQPFADDVLEFEGKPKNERDFRTFDACLLVGKDADEDLMKEYSAKDNAKPTVAVSPNDFMNKYSAKDNAQRTLALSPNDLSFVRGQMQLNQGNQDLMKEYSAKDNAKRTVAVLPNDLMNKYSTKDNAQHTQALSPNRGQMQQYNKGEKVPRTNHEIAQQQEFCEDNEYTSKKEKKGFFTKIFGGGRKIKSNASSGRRNEYRTSTLIRTFKDTGENVGNRLHNLEEVNAHESEQWKATTIVQTVTDIEYRPGTNFIAYKDDFASRKPAWETAGNDEPEDPKSSARRHKTEKPANAHYVGMPGKEISRAPLRNEKQENGLEVDTHSSQNGIHEAAGSIKDKTLAPVTRPKREEEKNGIEVDVDSSPNGIYRSLEPVATLVTQMNILHPDNRGESSLGNHFDPSSVMENPSSKRQEESSPHAHGKSTIQHENALSQPPPPPSQLELNQIRLHDQSVRNPAGPAGQYENKPSQQPPPPPASKLERNQIRLHRQFVHNPAVSDDQYENKLSQQPPPPPPSNLELKKTRFYRHSVHSHAGPAGGKIETKNGEVKYAKHRNIDSLTGGADLSADLSGRSPGMSTRVDSARFNRKVKQFRKNGSRNQNVIIPVNKTSDAQRSIGKKYEKKVPTFVTRHTMTRSAMLKAEPQHTSFASESSNAKTDGPWMNGEVRAAAKFSKASKAFKQSRNNYDTTKKTANGDIGCNKQNSESQIPVSITSISTSDGSGRSYRSTAETSSVTSDIRVLRNILRRPRNESVRNARPKSTFPLYDDKTISDPMQRAGLRLLSAAIIPIQTEVRRFLAMRRALTRMWALIVIQSYTRRWIARRSFRLDLQCIVKIQSVCRGFQLRNTLVYKHICAIEIQRFVRGYLSTMRVYEDIYKVTMVQSFVRMKLAMARATNRMAMAIQLQSVVRGFLVRCRLEYQEACAVAIQANWRSFSARLTYQFNLLDIIIVQSVWRRNLASCEIQYRRIELQNRSATRIQSRWRAYITKKQYTRYLAATRIQCRWRAYSMKKQYTHYLCATRIQSRWRAYSMKKQYTHYISATRIQSRWRAYSTKKQYTHYLGATCIQCRWRAYFMKKQYTHYLCATRIQCRWRAYSMKKQYTLYRSATRIQCRWRAYSTKKQYTHYLSATRIQSRWRAYSTKMQYKRYRSATRVQSRWRAYSTKKQYRRYRSATHIQSRWRAYSSQKQYTHYRSATAIQAAVRSFFARKVLSEYRSAKVIQAEMRRFICYRFFVRHRGATVIQAKWRSYDCTMNYLHYLADVLIVQSAIRRFLVFRRIRRIKQGAAIKIQSTWRGFVCYADYMFTIADIVVVQKMVRRWLANRNTSRLRDIRQIKAAIVVQQQWRGFMYARRIQRAWRALVHDRMMVKAALIIQKRWRCFIHETEFVVMKYEYYAARTIQSYWRRFWCFSNFIIALDCSIQIQAAYRGHYQRQALHTQMGAAVLIQSLFRVILAKKRTKSMQRVTKIKLTFREVSYLERSAAVVIQSKFRGMQSRCAVNLFLAARRIQSFVRGQQARTAIRLYLCSRLIQATWRAVTPRRVYVSYTAARKIQAKWRAKRMQNVYISYTAARKIQAKWRARRMQNAFLYYCAARKIQSLWRCKRMHAAYKFYRAALLIQTSYRGMKARRDFLVLRGESLAATLIQSAWRGFVCYTDYIFTVSDIIVAQKTARRYVARRKYWSQIEGNLHHRAKRESAAKALQRVCRGFIARQKYWYVLGCTMQIQSWTRGRLVIRHLRREALSRLKLQCFARRCLARQEYLQRKFILMLLRTADNERTKRVAAMVIQDRCRNFLEDRKRDDAARVIQRFFLMVKIEVDRLVNARKRKRNWRRKMKNRNDKLEEALLEDAWAYTVGGDLRGLKPLLLASSGSQDAGITEKNCLLITQLRTEQNSSASGSSSTHRTNLIHPVASQSSNLTSRQSGKPSNIVRMSHDDEKSEFSGLTASTVTFARPAISRMKRLGCREMDEDLELEEAFIDAEISAAKECNTFNNGLQAGVVPWLAQRGVK